MWRCPRWCQNPPYRHHMCASDRTDRTGATGKDEVRAYYAAMFDMRISEGCS